MRVNTPPHMPDLEEDDLEEVEVIEADDDNIVGGFMADDDDDIEDGEGAALSGDEDDNDEQLDFELNGGDPMDSGDDDESPNVPERDDAQLTFTGHGSPVFSCGIHPQRDWAVTGGQDDRVYVWDIKTGEVLHKIHHKDTVIGSCFNHDGTYLATGDMAGGLRVYKLVSRGASGSSTNPKEQAAATEPIDSDSEEGAVGGTVETSDSCDTKLEVAWECGMSELSWMRWHSAANVLLAGSDEGEIFMWRIPRGDCKVLPSPGCRCETADLSRDGRRLFAGYVNGIRILWDLKSGNKILEDNSDSAMVTAVTCCNATRLYMCGDSNGIVNFSTERGRTAEVEINGSVETIACSVGGELDLAATGTLKGQIAIWDVPRNLLRKICEHPEEDDGIIRIIWLNPHTLVAATVRGNIFGYDARTGTRIFSMLGHAAHIYEIEYSARLGILLSISEDHTAKIFKVPTLDE